MDVINTGQPHPLSNHAEGNTMRLLARVGAMTRPMQVQNQSILASPLRHRLNGGIANRQVDHDNDTSQFLGKLSTLIHVFHRSGSDVHVMALDFTCLSTGFVDCLYTIEEAIAPAHEGL